MSELHRVSILLLYKIWVKLILKLTNTIPIRDKLLLPDKQIPIQKSSGIRQISLLEKIHPSVQKCKYDLHDYGCK
jgi:hypothetical protein